MHGLATLVLIISGGASDPLPPGVIDGPHRYPPAEAAQHSDCVSLELQRFVTQTMAANAAKLGLDVPPLLKKPAASAQSPDDGGIAGGGDNGGDNDGDNDGAPTAFTFYPLTGTLDRDRISGNFVDLDPTAAFNAYNCMPFTYDGHAGIDTGLRDFAEQTVGVPVFAAADGTVTFAQDGWPDMNVNGGIQGNIIGITHPGNVETQYYHLKNGSVAVTVGQIVKAGQQIAMAASSGNSFGPHLHFQTMVNNAVYEPFAGPCRAGPSGWVNQPPMDLTLRLYDFGITKQDLNALPNGWWLPYKLPGEPQIAINEPAIRLWWKVYNFPPNCPLHLRFYRPDNSLAWEWQFNWGSTELYRVFSNWFGFDFQAMGPMLGTWHLLFELNNQVMIDAPFEVVTTVNPAFNHPPEPVTLSFDPPNPTTSDVLSCRVNQAVLAMDDKDWDTVRYHYVWKVNGQTVRDVVNAAMSDAIAHHTACGDSLVQCTVTPNDGKVDGTTVSISVNVTGAHSPDVNCSGHVNIDDLLQVINTWGPCASPCPADCVPAPNGNGVVNIDDLLAIINAWG